jgi:hypothetical protein
LPACRTKSSATSASARVTSPRLATSSAIDQNRVRPGSDGAGRTCMSFRKRPSGVQSTLAGRLGRIAFASSGRTFRDSLPKSTEPGRPPLRDLSNVHTERKGHRYEDWHR